MGETKESFFIKDDYDADRIKEVQDLLQAGEEIAKEDNKKSLLLPVPRNDGIDIWHEGFAFTSIHPRSFKMIGKDYFPHFLSIVCKKDEYEHIQEEIEKGCEGKLKKQKVALKAEIFASEAKLRIGEYKKFLYDDGVVNKENLRLMQKTIERGMPEDKERKSQHRIMQQHQSYGWDKYSICGTEVTIPKKYINDKPSEIDLVAFNPSKGKILLIEYKCDNKTLLQGDQNVEGHYKDYTNILKAIDEGKLKFQQEVLKAWNVMRRIKGLKPEDYDLQKIKVEILFLITNVPIDMENWNPNKAITDEDYENARQMVEACTHNPQYKDRIWWQRESTPDTVVIEEKRWKK